MGSFLFNDKTEWASSRELHGLAALTFNDRECAGVMVVIGKALEPKDNTWRTLHKVRFFVRCILWGDYISSLYLILKEKKQTEFQRTPTPPNLPSCVFLFRSQIGFYSLGVVASFIFKTLTKTCFKIVEKRGGGIH